VTKPAYDKTKQAYDVAVVAKNTYDTVTKPAYDKAFAEYHTALAEKKTYDTITKPAYDIAFAAKKAYDIAFAAKKAYDDALMDYTNLFEIYGRQLSQYNAHVAYKSAIDTYVLSV
jgi:hypothetical protein